MLSVLRAGHELKLYAYRRPPNLPNGVVFESASEILPQEKFVYYRGHHAALGSNLFRYKLLESGCGIWLDTDVLMLAPIRDTDLQVCGWQSPTLVNNAVLYLHPDSVVLSDLLEYTSNEYPVPPFLDAKKRLMIRFARAIGRPIHVSNLPWGVWGPNALTYFILKHGLGYQVSPQEVFYPIPYTKCHWLVVEGIDVDELIADKTIAIHLWNTSLARWWKSRSGSKLTHPRIAVESGSYVGRFFRRELGLLV